MRCPICGKTPRCGGVGLVRHVVKKHPALLRCHKYRPKSQRPEWCWSYQCLLCLGPWRATTPRNWANYPSALKGEPAVHDHWAARGGLDAHFLEASLGG